MPDDRRGPDHQRVPEETLPTEIEDRADAILDYIARYSPRPTVDGEIARRILAEAPPAQAAEELQRMIDGFSSGGGAATGPRSMPAAEDSPVDDLGDRSGP